MGEKSDIRSWCLHLRHGHSQDLDPETSQEVGLNLPASLRQFQAAHSSWDSRVGLEPGWAVVLIGFLPPTGQSIRLEDMPLLTELALFSRQPVMRMAFIVADEH